MNNTAQPASSLRSRAVRSCRPESGAAIVEFSLVVTLFFFLLYGIIAFGMAIGVKQNVTHAAFTGARAAVGYSDPAVAKAKAQAAAVDAMSENAAGATVPAPEILTPCPGSASGTCIRVTVNYDYGAHPVVPNAPGLGVVLPNDFSSTSTVQIS